MPVDVTNNAVDDGVDHDKVKEAIKQWRDSLVNLDGNNKLLNFKNKKVGTVEFILRSASEVFDLINGPQPTYVMGTKPLPVRKQDPTLLEGTATPEEVLGIEPGVVEEEEEEFNPENYPFHLFSGLTQPQTDKALKQVGVKAREEYIDRGIRVLYVSFGELHWQPSDRSDQWRSPLFLMPVSIVEEAQLGGGYEIQFTGDDPVVNPALGLQLLEDFGIQLPSPEEVLARFEEDGIAGVLDCYRDVTWPEGWEIVDSAILDTVVFANESMFRDLIDNEEAIAQSRIVQSLSGGIGPMESSFDFDPITHHEIDAAAEPETTPLILDADSSQRAAIKAAVDGHSFIMDGPPGTGKSQTISNIIGALIEAGKSVLFVSEKAVALDVVRDRLSARGLGHFIFELHDKKANRKEVAKRLGNALNNVPEAPNTMDEVQLRRLRETRKILTDYATAANEKRQPLGVSFYDILGRLEQQACEIVGPPFAGDALTITSDQMVTIETTIDRLCNQWPVIRQGKDAVWYGAIKQEDPRYVIQQIRPLLERINDLLHQSTGIRQAFGFDNGKDLERAAKLLSIWHQEPDFQQDPWLTITAIPALQQAVSAYVQATKQLDASTAHVQEVLGPQWTNVKPLALDTIPDPDVDQYQIPGLTARTTAQAALGFEQRIAKSAKQLAGIQQAVEALAFRIGIKPPTHFGAIESALRLAEGIIQQTPLVAEWVVHTDQRRQAQTMMADVHMHTAQVEQAHAHAQGSFNEQTLSTDINQVVHLGKTATGLFKQFSADHKQLRQLLSAISPLDWKTALSELPKAQAWVQAHQVYLQVLGQAQATFGSFLAPTGEIRWDQVQEALALAEHGEGLSVIHPQQLAQASGLPQVRHELQQIVAYIRTNLSQWQHENAALVDEDHVAVPDIELAAKLLAHHGSIVHRIKDVIMRSQHLGPNATLHTYIQGAIARAHVEQASIVASQTRGVVQTLVPIGGAQSSPSHLEAQMLSRKLAWVQAMHLAVTNNNGPFVFTQTHIDALRQSYPIANADQLVSQYRDLVQQFLSWFSPERQQLLIEDLQDYEVASDVMDDFSDHGEAFFDWFEIGTTKQQIAEIGLGPAAGYALQMRMDKDLLSRFLYATVYRAWLDQALNSDPRFALRTANSRDELVNQFKELDQQLHESAIGSIIEKGNARRPRSVDGQARIIHREAEKKRKHIPVYELIAQARDVILRLHPCFMMSPHAVSQYLPNERMFDVVIFDEASQVRPGDAINCIYRGKSLIAAGDQKQLPPTNFFQSQGNVDEEADDDMAKDYESVLDLMMSSGSFRRVTLNWHYRSRHEHLIAFSNKSFYESRLITFPGALAESEDAGVNFFKVDGVYRRGAGQDNPIEAQAVAQRVMHHFATRPDKTLGVVTFSQAQQDCVYNAIELAKQEHPELLKYFTEDRAHGFFVKSLEKVQGDERDVIIFSVGYGRDEHGRMTNSFGPLNRDGGERRLNVAVTRAKELIEVVSSITAADIKDSETQGVRHFRRYLDYAQRGPAALEMELAPSGRGTDSPFEDAVIAYIESLGYDVQPQVGVAGYRIDIGVKHPNQPGAFMVGIECDGAMYHSSRAARDRDRLRHEILEGLGWNLYHIWGTDWYRTPEREKARLKAVLEEAAAQQVTGRVQKSASSTSDPIRIETVAIDLDSNPEWVTDYQCAEIAPLSDQIDIQNPVNAVYLKPVIESLAQVEAPIHIDVVRNRIRDLSTVNSIGARIRSNIDSAVQMANVRFDGEFIRLPHETIPSVRANTERFERSIRQIAPEEIRMAITQSISESISIQRTDLIPKVAYAFGFKRTGPDIRQHLDQSITELVVSGVIQENGSGLIIPEQ